MLILPHEENYCWSYSAFWLTWLVWSGHMTSSERMTCLTVMSAMAQLGCMHECCHGFSAGKLLAAFGLHCVNCRLNPNHNKPCALHYALNQWFPTCRTCTAGVHLLYSWNKLTLRHKNYYLCSSKNPKVLMKIQWIFVVLLSLLL